MLIQRLGIVQLISSIRLGQCPRCARKAFLAACAATGLAVSATTLAGGSLVTLACCALAACLAGLWLSHLTVFALNASAIDRAMLEKNPDQPGSRARRTALRRFGQAFAFAMLATAAVGPRAAKAQACPCGDNAPQCCWNYDRTVHVCAPSDANCCGARTSPWYCPNGHNCLGDGESQRSCS